MRAAGGQRLKKALDKLRRRQVREIAPDPLTPEWAAAVDLRLERIERQLKLLNSGLLIAVLADIAIRLIGLK